MTASPPALRAVLAHLRCPVCQAALASDTAGLTCPSLHRFDVARHGYVNLRTGRAGKALGDDARMVAARHAFLDSGHYAPLSAALARAVRCASGALVAGWDAWPLVVDVGAGTAHHLCAALGELPRARGLALDASTAALRRCARAHPRVAAVGADVWTGLPLADSTAAVVLDVFSPRNPREFGRILRPDGRLVVAVPHTEHLEELVGPLGLLGVDGEKQTRLEDQMSDRFTPVSASDIRWRMELSAADAGALVAMTPSARHLSADAVTGALSGLGSPISVLGSVRILTYAPTARPAADRQMC